MTTTTAQKKTAENMQATIQVSGVSAHYGRMQALKDIHLSVDAGKVYGLIGLNGAGKTTLIKVILGLMPASHGHVHIMGTSSVDKNTKKHIAYLPEKFEPPAFLSGMEFVKFSQDLYGSDFDAEKVLQAADRLDLSRDALKRKVSTYSKGMRQKTGLMGTWLTGCPLLILDEPMSGLDPRARVRVKDEILACRQAGMTVFLSSHILADMDEICDQIAVIHEGTLYFEGTPQHLKEQTHQEHLERAFLQLIEKPKQG